MNEAKLVADCLKRLPKAQKDLYESFLPYIITIIRRFGYGDSDRVDLVQDVFAEIFISLPKYDSEKGSLKSWIQSITVYRLLNHKRQQKIQFENDVELSNLMVPEINYDSFELDIILEAIVSLPEGYRLIFNLFEIEGFSHEEIANTLGISSSTSRSQLTRAKQLLQKKLACLNPVK